MTNTVKVKPLHCPAVTSASEPADLVTVEHGQPVTDSRLVAAEFGKSHKHVLRSIDALQVDLSSEFWRSNFGPSTYVDERGKVQRMFRMTQAGFTALVMGFTGKKSVQLRERFIVAFQRTAAELHRLKAMQAAPEWKPARIDTKRAFRLMTDVIKETRDDAGKPATTNTYMHESWTVNYAMTGVHQTSIDRDALPPEELRLLELIEVKNTVLFVRGLSRKDRQHILRGVVLQARADRVARIVGAA